MNCIVSIIKRERKPGNLGMASVVLGAVVIVLAVCFENAPARASGTFFVLFAVAFVGLGILLEIRLEPLRRYLERARMVRSEKRRRWCKRNYAEGRGGLKNLFGKK